MDHFLKLRARYGAEEVLDEYPSGIPPQSTTTVCHFIRQASTLRSVRARTFARPEEMAGLLVLGPVLVDGLPVEFGADDGSNLSELTVEHQLHPGQSVSVVLVNDCEFALSCEVEVELDVIGEE